MRTSQLAELARRYWQALCAVPFDSSHGNLVGFPKECCQSASYLFAIHLLKCHNEESTVVFANRGTAPAQRHVWVSLDGAIVDLTCGQFSDDAMPDYYVGPVQEWHATWKIIDRDTTAMTLARADILLAGFFRSAYDLLDSHLASISSE